MASDLSGSWRVRREAGLLPPGVTKRIGDDRGLTLLGGLPFGAFRVEGTTLRYKLWPIRDELERDRSGTWHGRGLLFGVPFCRFRLERA